MYTYAIIGAGRQGTASAYDLARFGDAELILLADTDLHQAESAADRINRLIGHAIAKAHVVDASDKEDVVRFLKGNAVDAFISGAPYFYSYELTEAAIEAGAGMTDMGGNSEIVFQQLGLSSQAEAAGISIIPDCGLTPGMSSTLILYGMEQFDEPLDAFIYDCGLPIKPEPPWNYALTFSIEGLTNEYFGDCIYIRDWKTTLIPALQEYEILEFPEPIGTLEAFTTSGGFSSAAHSLVGKLRTLQNKTMRYPGHFEQVKLMEQLGLLELEPIEVDGNLVVPRHVLHTLWDPQIRSDEDTKDLVFVHIIFRGKKDGQLAELHLDVLLYHDDETGFTAMEQGTGWHASIMTIAIAKGEIPKGVIPVEKAMSGSSFAERAAQRGFSIQIAEKPYSGE
jgi:lysine 6-dehydrogenase